ncbi:MAG: hypothetical protein ACRDQA_15170 [Nocardioidaceae bacterium]
MSAERRRRTSKLVGQSTMLAASQEPTTPPTDTRGPRSDDRVGFNCKMDRELRRAVRRYAADAEMDIQDIVDEALREYLSARRSVEVSDR